MRLPALAHLRSACFPESQARKPLSGAGAFTAGRGWWVRRITSCRIFYHFSLDSLLSSGYRLRRLGDVINMVLLASHLEKDEWALLPPFKSVDTHSRASV